MANINLKEAIISEERSGETTIEECLYLIVSELLTEAIDLNNSVA